MKDGRGLSQLDEERGLPCQNAIAGSNARKDAIDGSQARTRCRNLAAHLSHDNDEASLAQERGLASHVGAREEHEPLRATLSLGCPCFSPRGRGAAEGEGVGDIFAVHERPF